jgi:hypothetical protein
MKSKTNKKHVTAPAGQFNRIMLATRSAEDMHVFTESRHMPDGEDCEPRQEAHDLFSLFTANIIREKVIFVR